MQFPLAFLTNLDGGTTLQLIGNYKVVIVQIRTTGTKVKLCLNYRDQ